MQIRKNFSEEELACPCCGICNISEDALDKLQALREKIGVPFSPNSAARCKRYNKKVGGAKNSQHISTIKMKSTAFDIPIKTGMDKRIIIETAEKLGFGGIGINYNTFVHVDDRGHKARW